MPGEQLEAHVPDLKERSEFQFRIRAVNKAGPSEPSDPTNMHLVKHRARKYFLAIPPVMNRDDVRREASFSEAEDRPDEPEADDGEGRESGEVRREHQGRAPAESHLDLQGPRGKTSNPTSFRSHQTGNR